MRWRWATTRPIDPSVFVRMPLVDEPGTSLLVWTTTPWTLPGNVAVAAHPDVDYVTVERALARRRQRAPDPGSAAAGESLRRRASESRGNLQGQASSKGKRYHPLFTFLPPDKPAYYVVLEDFVTTEDGTGLVHIAPAFGAEDMQAAQEYDLPILMTVADGWHFHPRGAPLERDLRQGCRPADHPGPASARPALPRRHLSPTPTRSAGAAIRPCCIMPATPGTSAPASSRTGWWS